MQGLTQRTPHRKRCEGELCQSQHVDKMANTLVCRGKNIENTANSDTVDFVLRTLYILQILACSTRSLSVGFLVQNIDHENVISIGYYHVDMMR